MVAACGRRLLKPLRSGHFTRLHLRELSQASVDLYLGDLERLGVIERDVGERFRFLVPLPVA
ncbi:hypothetical protein [Sediminicurvatus halobius]|uniref:Uncharacterized protein n=1 Tax=Sediminicurvatus halobius TaxID=2182432 RepID=A0A2U2MWF3_9GAMM|nr:hypothetical protein [Spiribacter halobius]PWG61195.1 hypothetical protein DEM34_17595 [Spiribacter halobius]UEX77933.1 hypothetical protein LMH63_18720 [Spiribacter halobius]